MIGGGLLDLPHPLFGGGHEGAAAVVGATGCGSVYDLDTLRAAYLATDDPHERAAIEAAARVLLDREAVPA